MIWKDILYISTEMLNYDSNTRFQMMSSRYNDSVDLFDLIDNVPWSSLSAPKVGFQPQWFWFIGGVPLNPLYR